MLTRHHRALELDKILEKLAALTTVSDARDLALQLTMLTTGILIFLLMTVLSFRKACQRFEKIDL